MAKKGLWFDKAVRGGEYHSRDGRFKAVQRSSDTKGWVFEIYDQKMDGLYVGKAAKMPGVVSRCKEYLREEKRVKERSRVRKRGRVKPDLQELRRQVWPPR